MRNFMQLLRARWAKGLSVCVGLDSDYERLPDVIREKISWDWKIAHFVTDRIIEFNVRIIDACAEFAACFKPNWAFYLAHGLPGLEALKWTIGYIQKKCPEIPVILDAKVGDIGDTNDFYVQALLTAFMQADAVTVHNYLGQRAMQPFLKQKDKGIIVLCRTSNPGAEEFQDLKIFSGPILVDNEPMYRPLYQVVAKHVVDHWNLNGNCGLVVGAIYPNELSEVRKIVGDALPILIPGVGKQGGDVAKVVLAGRDSHGQGMIINSSSGIIFASHGSDFAEAARRETEKLHNQIQAVLSADGVV